MIIQSTSVFSNQPYSVGNKFWNSTSYSLNNFGKFSFNQYDYEDIQYGIPFNDFYNYMENRYISFNDNTTFPPYVITGHIKPYISGDDRLLITGCSDNHFVSAIPAMLAMINASATVNIGFLDFGITKEQIGELIKVFDFIHKVHLSLNSSSIIVYRKFDFRKAPSWMDIFNCDTRGGYSWKVIGYMDILFEWNARGAWIDAGSIIHDGIDIEFGYAQLEGMYVPVSPGNISTWTHPGMISFVEELGMTKRINQTEGNCSSGHFFMDFRNITVVNTIFKPFLQCAYTMKCITPKLSDKSNHRQEQAGITLFLHNGGLKYSARGKYSHTALFRQERKGQEYMNNLAIQLKNRIMNENNINSI